ncbi:ImmA/IrrE family metallo-endopeptidase [Asticcacaulis sp. AC460]|uniref:ImmA/IrrE family metallo-endopeptidase n=1 Tax=Asticcacaulis sp. AC460 TaxID=1282360 RepID=UPI0009DCC824|nr:ImmA/IrrE family metallo-endopeptidase [Asticcacaulis sp. AC460]
MTRSAEETPFKAAARLTKILDTFDGVDRFDRNPVDVESLALDYSRQICPEEPIDRVHGQPLDGCEGALVPSESGPTRWGILYNSRQNKGRKNFTIAHELGHYLLHRQLAAEGIYCDEESIIRRDGKGIEKEADEFAANLLMPLNDFRMQIPPKNYAAADDLSSAASRYGVSLTAAALRWLQYTERRAMVIVSNEGFVHWARASDAAFKTGIFMRTRNTMNEMPASSLAVSADFSEQQTHTVDQLESVWFSEACREICIRSRVYDQEITVLQFEGASYRPFGR